MVSVPNAELFTIRIGYINDGVQRLAGYVDYCCADQISRLELISMAMEFDLPIEGCSIWWVDSGGENNMLKEISTDLDALRMAECVTSTREVHVYFKIANSEFDLGSDSVNASKGKMSMLKNRIFSLDSDGEATETFENPRAIIDVNVQPSRVGSDVGLDSNCATSDELHSCSSADEDELGNSNPRYPEFNEHCDMRSPDFKIGMKFGSFNQFKEPVRSYEIKNRYEMNFNPNDKKRCRAYCMKGCPFYLWASLMIKDGSTVEIKSGNLNHECSRDHTNRHVNDKWIARVYLEQFSADPTWKIQGIIQAVKTNQEIDISRLKAYRAKSIALRIIDGDDKTQIYKLLDYRLELLRTHPGSTIKFKCHARVFQAMYVCLAPLKEGFLTGCRQIIGVDGCFLKGIYGGQLLTAVGIDANDCIYPIAWAIVNKENKENWKWFMELLTEDLQITNSFHWSFMSDRQKDALYSMLIMCSVYSIDGCETYMFFFIDDP
ncbi:uncharacterized protein LOC120265007 [Dioscorea cayenensis subsp. rotundata]|uniref:Uncharacterized protein LOC120265007 n=1 Tax=Dioscorea cayennensis subsp. rotundata TaxID=55577 RepID=A0AB40BQB1_DIOCR|nr:uncharacterized protein LOC120265007 [Dioscorea cayenensis subsp. rotundata]